MKNLLIKKKLNEKINRREDMQAYEKLFRLKYDDYGYLVSYKRNEKKIERETDQLGFFVIVTSKKMSAKNALQLYKSRDESEKLFRADKSYLGNDVFRNASDESIEAKSLVEFAALIVRNRIFTYFDEAIEQGIKKQNYLTVPAAIKELEKIELVRQSDGKYRLDHAVTATQKVILNAVGITPSTIPNKAQKLSQELEQADKMAV